MEKGQFDEKAVERLKRMTWLYERLPEKENKVVQKDVAYSRIAECEIPKDMFAFDKL